MSWSNYESVLGQLQAYGLKVSAVEVGRIVRHLVDVGFKEVGVSPVATELDRFDLSAEDLQVVLGEIRELADEYFGDFDRGEAATAACSSSTSRATGTPRSPRRYSVSGSRSWRPTSRTTLAFWG